MAYIELEYLHWFRPLNEIDVLHLPPLRPGGLGLTHARNGHYCDDSASRPKHRDLVSQVI